jgi:hypothetical protein
VGRTKSVVHSKLVCNVAKYKNKPTQASVSEGMKVQKQTHFFAFRIGKGIAITGHFLDLGENAAHAEERRQVVLHHRSRSAPGSHPSGTVVAQHQSDNCAIHPLSHSERGDRSKSALRREAARPPSPAVEHASHVRLRHFPACRCASSPRGKDNCKNKPTLSRKDGPFSL